MNKNIIKLFAILMMCFLLGSVLVACGSTNEGEEDIFTVEIKNGNWFINGVDTGVKAEGKDGQQGLPGQNGADLTDKCENEKHDYNIYDGEHVEANILVANGNKWEIKSHAHDCVPSIVEGAGKQATCTEGGYDVFTCDCPRGTLWVCVDCGEAKFQWTEEKTWKGNFTEKLPHDYKSVVTKPTCLAEGFTTNTCTMCGDTYTDAKTAKVDHTWGDWEPKLYPADACKCDLPVEENRFCQVDGCSAQEYRKLSDATGHTFTKWEPTIDATDKTSPCERVDLVVSYCDVCGHKECNKVKPVEGDEPDGHVWGDWTVVTAPTLTAKGLIKRECKNCSGYASSTETKELPALNKTDYVHAVVTAPDCDDTGKDTYTYTVDGQTLPAFEVTVAANGHNYTSGNYTNLVKPGYPKTEEEVAKCTGSVDVICDVCGEKKNVEVSALTKATGKYIITVGNCLTPYDEYYMPLDVDGFQVFVNFTVKNDSYIHDEQPANLTILNGEKSYYGYWCTKCEHWVLVEEIKEK